MLSDLPVTKQEKRQKTVLILVLMEYALWLWQIRYTPLWSSGLNPCSNGICSLTMHIKTVQPQSQVCLNPCSNGICSLIEKARNLYVKEKCLNPCSNGICSLIYYLKCIRKLFNVLILVLMEYAFWLGEEPSDDMYFVPS